MPETREICTIRDVFFKEEIEGATPFQVRRGDFLRPEPIHDLPYGRLYDVADEVAIRDCELKKTQEAEAARDKTFEEFMAMFQDHIEGKVDANTRVGNRPATPEPNPDARGSTIQQKDGAADGKSAKGSIEEKSQHGSKYESIRSEGGRSAASSRLITSKSDNKQQ